MHIYLYVFILLICYSSSIYSQVTIGSSKPPIEGSLLDLKEDNETTRGLGLPRVALKSLTELYPCVSEEDSEDKSKHIGLILYNVTEQGIKPKDPCEPFPNLDPRLVKGIHIWSGEEWIGLGIEREVDEREDPEWLHPSVNIFHDVDGNNYLYRKFGDAGTWMTENYRGTTYSENTEGYDPTRVIEVGSPVKNNNTPKYSYPSPPNADGSYPSDTDDTAFRKMPNLGLFYNWAAATNSIIPTAEGQHIQGICPDGWHVPWDFEYKELQEEIQSNATEYAQEDVSPELSSTRWILTPCLPYAPLNRQAGGSLMAAEGGMALLWNGSAGREYGSLSAQIALKWDSQTVLPKNKYGNMHIRNSYTENEWFYPAAYHWLHYILRCKKDVDD